MKWYRNLSTGEIRSSLEVVGCMLNSGQWGEVNVVLVPCAVISESTMCYTKERILDVTPLYGYPNTVRPIFSVYSSDVRKQ